MLEKIIDGKKLSLKLKEHIKNRSEDLYKLTGKRPKLTVIMVGNNQASKVYVSNKEKSCNEVGIHSNVLHYDNIDTDKLIEIIKELNEDKDVNGILVQLPLSSNIDEKKVIEAIDPIKDVDGFHPYNTGKLWINGDPYFYPCTPYGIYKLLIENNVEISGKNAVIIGRSNIVGKPIASILLKNDATVTICHSKTSDLSSYTLKADILIAAVGKPYFVKKDMVKEGAVVIDVGINRIIEDGKNKIVGDVDYNDVFDKVSKITPVPGGVGPMTIAVLLENTLKAFMIQNNIK
ncbi:MAG TPA: bifunctional methylenetetrahydrofolate dehydrogenase/methenyltetrahydrofolate cyclohydrolase FolD [Spirochaetota bacterium]|nr:bifunctional methylenetetrahydrofolate dehydrogenase/methenyltetrahydrofolate cyclohydrolase FolD [Spirochaetota bacterium]HOM38536.1 bifunctional methylenetetrahydrofolate dehydrogenase/methenyltetrahydrofolate cyclohydrolase FolD [Spirochaetota bacterium]HPQ49076.1 bifunctional methylenetetrahydrofolate dehydrogenase/methenyltetrahydrofolate cyclohydrolase FolD [Spirochaetota bacterium]